MVQQRSIGLGILFSIITCGIYGLYWMYKVLDESREISRDNEGSAGLDILLTIITCGIYGFFAFYKAGSRIYEADITRGNRYATNDTALIVILYLFGSIVSVAILQHKINKFITA